MILGKKIKAGALQFVLFIGAVIAILLMAFMLLSHTHSHFDKKTDLVVAVIKSAGFGINASLGKNIPLESSISIPSENEAEIDLNVKRELWGIFEKRTATARHGNTTQNKIALVGGVYSEEIPALYLKDKQRPMIIAGNAKITGTAYLPEQGVKMGNIYGNSYNQSRLVYGRTMRSDSTLPSLSNEIRNQIKLLAQENFVPDGEVLSTIPVKELTNSFTSPTLIIRNRSVRLRDMKLKGNIIVSASDRIIVESDSDLRDIILLAPKIIIKDWVKGNFQAIASQSISVGKKCELYYPSALVVQKKPEVNILEGPENNERPNFLIEPKIYIDQYSEIDGVVTVLEETEEPQYTPQIKVEENAKVTGELLCTQNLELKGRVNGMVVAGGFIALENGSVYQNHLYNGLINSQNLNSSYAGLLMEKSKRTKKVMKWLY